MEWVGVVLFGVGVLVALVVALWLFQRSLDQPGGRDGLGTMGNGMGVMDNFFSPSRADAAEELERQKRAAHVMPSPDEDDELRHGLVRRNPDGSPRSIRLTRPPEDG
ncbi:hypothetical protein [Aeromicrobium sp.]|uniref:hypothetical protein n=1 Tax=Aeromicrobium sp. TaxID=1871063 RepID=UPI003517DE26